MYDRLKKTFERGSTQNRENIAQLEISKGSSAKFFFAKLYSTMRKAVLLYMRKCTKIRMRKVKTKLCEILETDILCLKISYLFVVIII